MAIRGIFTEMKIEEKSFDLLRLFLVISEYLFLCSMENQRIDMHNRKLR